MPRFPAPSRDEADGGVAMTPMIDIVFQLLVFFLLTLHFRSVDHRIEAALPAAGLFAQPPPLPEERARVRVTVHGAMSPAEPTRLRVGGGALHQLPAAGPGRAAVLQQVKDEIRALARMQAASGPIRGEIRTPPPHGEAVRHGDVVGVVDAFLGADVLDVTFEGRPSPLPIGR